MKLKEISLSIYHVERGKEAPFFLGASSINIANHALYVASVGAHASYRRALIWRYISWQYSARLHVVIIIISRRKP